MIPPGHGEAAGPEGQLRCERCAVILQNPHPASLRSGQWEGWCPTHGLTPGRVGDREQILEDARIALAEGAM